MSVGAAWSATGLEWLVVGRNVREDDVAVESSERSDGARALEDGVRGQRAAQMSESSAAMYLLRCRGTMALFQREAPLLSRKRAVLGGVELTKTVN